METLTPAEVATTLGVSPNKVRQLVREGKLMAVPGSGNSKIPADFLQDGDDGEHRQRGVAHGTSSSSGTG